MLSKESKIRVLENFYALDYVFFGKSVGQVESCCPLVKEEYLAIKGALLSVFVEMLKLVDHTPKAIAETVDSKMLMKNARESAQTARNNAQRIVSTDKSRANIKEALKEKIKEDKNLDISEAIERQIREQAFSLAVDSLLLARAVSESVDLEKLNDWEGTIIEDSYKILRDNLIESAYEILYEEDEEEEEEDEKKKVTETGEVRQAATTRRGKVVPAYTSVRGKKVPKKAVTTRRGKVVPAYKSVRGKKVPVGVPLEEKAITYSGSKVIKLAKQYGKAIEKKLRTGCEKWSVKAPFKGQEYRDKMMACKAKAAIKGLQSSASYAGKLSGQCPDLDCKKKIQNYLIDVRDEIKDNQSYVK